MLKKYWRRGIFKNLKMCENAQNRLKSRIWQTFCVEQRKYENSTYIDSYELINCQLSYILCIKQHILKLLFKSGYKHDFPTHMSAESPTNISPDCLELIFTQFLLLRSPYKNVKPYNNPLWGFEQRWKLNLVIRPNLTF